MLTNTEMNQLRGDRNYKKTLSFFYNCRFASNTINTGHSDIAATLCSDGSLSFSASLIRAFWLISKLVRISREIGAFRNLVIENIFNSQVLKIPIRDFISSQYRWVEPSISKMRDMRSYTSIFLSDSRVAEVFYTHSKHPMKHEVYIEYSQMVIDSYNSYIEWLARETLRKYRDNFREYTAKDVQAAMISSLEGKITDGR